MGVIDDLILNLHLIHPPLLPLGRRERSDLPISYPYPLMIFIYFGFC